MIDNKDNVIIFAHYHNTVLTCNMNDNINENNKDVVEDTSNGINKAAIKQYQ